MIKYAVPGETKFIKFPPSRAREDVKCPGYARGGGMFNLRFDWYITFEYAVRLKDGKTLQKKQAGKDNSLDDGAFRGVNKR